MQCNVDRQFPFFFFLRKYYGDWNPLLGILFLKLGKIQLYADLYIDSMQNFARAEDILKITHGRGHSIIINQLRPMMVDALRATSMGRQ